MKDGRATNPPAVKLSTRIGVLSVIGGAVLLILLFFFVGARFGLPGRDNFNALNQSEAKAAYQAVLVSMHIPEFHAFDQDARPVGRELFLGHCTVLHFAFTHCVTVCPITTAKMMRVQDAAKLLKGKVKLVSISVDPAHDTPEQLRSHAHEWADFSIWTWISADQPTLESIVGSGLGFPLDTDAKSTIDLGNGQSMSNIRHTSRLLLLDPAAKVIGMYDGTDDADISRLIDEMRDAAAKQDREKRG